MPSNSDYYSYTLILRVVFSLVSYLISSVSCLMILRFSSASFLFSCLYISFCSLSTTMSSSSSVSFRVLSFRSHLLSSTYCCSWWFCWFILINSTSIRVTSWFSCSLMKSNSSTFLCSSANFAPKSALCYFTFSTSDCCAYVWSSSALVTMLSSLCKSLFFLMIIVILSSVVSRCPSISLICAIRL